MEFNRPSCTGTFAQIARALEIGNVGDSNDVLSRRLIDEVAQLLKSVGIPGTLKDLGLPADRQEWTAESALGITRLVKNNPRPLDLAAMQAITRAAYTGDRASLRTA
jgi:alcohol dehydrogenase class IV